MMGLLDDYLKAVRLYLPTGSESDDVISELGELLRSQVEDREKELSRALSERELEALLAHHGNPLVVASQYSRVNQGLAFGRQLISPELFPNYLRALVTVLVITMLIAPFLLYSRFAVLTHPLQLLAPMLFQVVLITIIYVGLDAGGRWSSKGAASQGRQGSAFSWTYLRPTPRWLSVMGFVVMAMVTIWWINVLRKPALVLGPGAASIVHLSPVWGKFHTPLTVLLLANLGHRVASFVRPNFNWIRPVGICVVNAVALAMLYPILGFGPLFEAAPASGSGGADLARMLSVNFWWYWIGFGIYWAINLAINGRLFWQLMAARRFPPRRSS